ncbi:hypothetical protein GCM10010430_77210 [Kitasatospora cystarginea]|uniref:DUF485 domain-containing protein n=1 Tax=Kitasatospora cystarginea TaxID=58350 RepID=A0ABN3F0F7_9ACTN
MLNTSPPQGSSQADAPCDCRSAAECEADRLTRYQAVANGEAVTLLRRRYRRFAAWMTVLFLAVYLSYVLLSGYAHRLMAVRVVGTVNVAFVAGLLQFAMTFLIAWLYTRYAATRLDPVAERARAEFDDTQDHQAGARQGGRDPEGSTCAR